MNIDKLFKDEKELNKQYSFHLKNNIEKIEPNKNLVIAHLEKAKHNLLFFQKNKKNTQFNDWLITILYYSLYQTALALITHKNFKSKNHTATIIILIKHYASFENELKIMNELEIKKEDAILYTKLKKDRQDASYTANTKFTNEKIGYYKSKTIEFLNKTQAIIHS